MKSQDKMRFFEQSEFEDRLRKVKESMYRRGMEVLLVTDPANMNYLTGYDGWSFYVHQCSEPIYVTESGCATFVDFERTLFVK